MREGLFNIFFIRINVVLVLENGFLKTFSQIVPSKHMGNELFLSQTYFPRRTITRKLCNSPTDLIPRTED